MDETVEPPRAGVVPLPLRAFALLPVAPIWCGLLLFGALVGGLALYCGVTGLSFRARFLDYELLQLVTLAFTPTAAVYAQRGALRDLRDLRPSLDLGAEELAALEASLSRFSPWALRAAGLFGAALASAFAFLPAGWPDGRPPLGDPVFDWVLARTAFLGFAVGATGYVEIVHGLRFGRLGGRHARVSILDARPLFPLARRGLRSVGVWMGLSMLFAALFFEPWAQLTSAIFTLAFASLAVGSLLIPVWPVHRRLQAERAAELQRIQAALWLARDRNLEPGGQAVDARLANLVAYHGLVESAPTWPIGVSTWLRFAAFVAIGLGSWVGAAVVERLLGRMLEV